LINVTYVGDTLIATKLTGDQNVPSGELTFSVDLSPKAAPGLDPIELSDTAEEQWGQKHLPRFAGEGQIAAKGFVDNQWVEGQLIIVGAYFSFVWLPIGCQIFFGRPNANLTLRMIKEDQMVKFGATDGKSPSDIAQMRAFTQRCYEESEFVEDELELEGELIFHSGNVDYFEQKGCFE